MDFPIHWDLVAFAAFSTIAIVGSLMVVLKKNPVASAFSLVLVFFAFAGLYATLGAHVVAALQILVYTGAIMVLFVFVIMLLNQDEDTDDLKKVSPFFAGFAVLSVAALGSVFYRALSSQPSIQPRESMTPQQIAELGGNFQIISEMIFTKNVFTFELTSFLLLGAIVATVTLSKRNRLKSRGSR